MTKAEIEWKSRRIMERLYVRKRRGRRANGEAVARARAVVVAE